MKEKIKAWWFGFSERERYDILVKICLTPVVYLGVAFIFGVMMFLADGSFKESLLIGLIAPAVVLWWLLKVGIVLGILYGIGFGLYRLALRVAAKIQIKLKVLAGKDES